MQALPRSRTRCKPVRRGFPQTPGTLHRQRSTQTKAYLDTANGKKVIRTDWRRGLHYSCLSTPGRADSIGGNRTVAPWSSRPRRSPTAVAKANVPDRQC
ncbi:unnamed protein product [Protopolystoma xenopodis]|uniref:Uncharacterized protein n=1 Tax=Protopolystoma xenopodis TaxID=117903 RepID=A0A448XPH3_9PLAT|nr:unnamed protein product [Protopolystoma xenopodis]